MLLTNTQQGRVSSVVRLIDLHTIPLSSYSRSHGTVLGADYMEHIQPRGWTHYALEYTQR
jgi:hypothetical protein